MTVLAEIGPVTNTLTRSAYYMYGFNVIEIVGHFTTECTIFWDLAAVISMFVIKRLVVLCEVGNWIFYFILNELQAPKG